MKVVVLPGVNVEKDNIRYEKFLIKIKNRFKCQGEVYIWEVGWQQPETDLPYDGLRSFASNVILDFQQAIRHASKTFVPDADIYLGHSAGSIVALAQNKPCIIFGSPAVLTEMVVKREKSNTHTTDGELFSIINKIRREDRPVLNIINRYDVLAYPIEQENVENYVYSRGGLNPFNYFPVSAHHDYWDNDKVMQKIFRTIENWLEKIK